MIRTVAFLLLLGGAISAKVKPNISNFFDVCPRKLSNELLASCIKNTIEKARPRLVKGIPELGLLPIDPLYIEKIEMKENNGRFKLSQTLTNLKIYGMGDYAVKNISIDKDTWSLNITMFSKMMRFESAYKIDGQILVVPIAGEGHATYNFSDVTTTSFVTFKLVKKGNKPYLKIDSYKLSIEPQNARSHFTNLFNGDKRLGDATNALLNENWREAFNTYRQLPEEAFAQYMASLAGRVYTQYTLDELFPE